MIKNLYHIGTLILLSACVKEVSFDPDTFPSIPAIHCFITPDSILIADCRLTAPFGSKDMPVANANFSIWKSGQQIDTSLYLGSGIHKFATNSAKAGDTLIFMGRGGAIRPFEIPVVVPGYTQINTLDTTRQLVPGIGRAFSVAIRFNDNAAIDNYYRCYLYKNAYKYVFDNTGKITDSFPKKKS